MEERAGNSRLGGSFQLFHTVSFLLNSLVFPGKSALAVPAPFLVSGFFDIKAAAVCASAVLLSGILGQAVIFLLPFPDFAVQTPVDVFYVKMVFRQEVQSGGNGGFPFIIPD